MRKQHGETFHERCVQCQKKKEVRGRIKRGLFGRPEWNRSKGRKSLEDWVWEEAEEKQRKGTIP